MDHPNAFFKTIKYLIHHLKNINFLIWKCQNETQQNTKIIIIKKLVWYLNIKSVNQSKKIILDTTVSIGKEKNIKVEPIDLPFKNKVMLYCDKLPFVILSPNFYLDIEKMNNFLITMIMFIIIFIWNCVERSLCRNIKLWFITRLFICSQKRSLLNTWKRQNHNKDILFSAFSTAYLHSFKSISG